MWYEVDSADAQPEVFATEASALETARTLAKQADVWKTIWVFECTVALGYTLRTPIWTACRVG
jgi:hypothetical protein